VKLTLTASALARLDRRIQPFGRWPAAPVLALLLPLAFWRRARKTTSRLSSEGALLLALLVLGIVASVTGCGGGGFFSHRTESATVTVTAVCGPDTHTTSVTLTVQ
jgi:hypothetical protein